MKNEEQANAELARISLAGTSVQGSYVEADKDIINALDMLGKKDFVIFKELRKHEVALNFAIGLAVGLLISMILIAWQTLN